MKEVEARANYGIKGLMPYTDPIYAEAHRRYIRNNYPIFWDRMRGVAESFGSSSSWVNRNILFNGQELRIGLVAGRLP